jgi:hypothetical protein
MDPSHMPRIKRNAKRPAKFLQAAMQVNAMPQMKMLILGRYIFEELRRDGKRYIPHPSTHRKTLEGEILRELEQQIAKVKDSSQPNINTELKPDEMTTRRIQTSYICAYAI